MNDPPPFDPQTLYAPPDKGRHPAPLAIASDGSLLLNLNELDDADAVEGALKRVLLERGEVFVGVRLSDLERARALELLAPGCREAAAKLIGARRRGDR